MKLSIYKVDDVLMQQANNGLSFYFVMSGWSDLNRRPRRPERRALPAELHPGDFKRTPGGFLSTDFWQSQI